MNKVSLFLCLLMPYKNLKLIIDKVTRGGGMLVVTGGSYGENRRDQ